MGSPRDRYWAPMLFNIFVSNLDDGIKYTPMKRADDTKPSGEADTLEERSTLQEDMDRLEEWANKEPYEDQQRQTSCTWENIIQECSIG